MPILSLLLLALAGSAGDAALAAPDNLSRVDRSLAHLNAVRMASGAPALVHSQRLALSASQHAAYLSRNGFRSAPTVHVETAGLDDFAGADPFVRIRRAGYRAANATEVIGDIGSTATDSDCVDHLMNTVYHAALLLSPVTEAGLAYGEGAAAGACVIDLAAPAAAAAGRAGPRAMVRYPSPGMTVATGSLRLDSETPRPAAGQLPQARVGIPVLVGLREARGSDASAVQIQEFELRDAATDTPVPCVILANGALTGPGLVVDAALHDGFAVLIPRQPLAPGRYRVRLHATTGAEVIAPAPWTFVVAAAETP